MWIYVAELIFAHENALQSTYTPLVKEDRILYIYRQNDAIKAILLRTRLTQFVELFGLGFDIVETNILRRGGFTIPWELMVCQSEESTVCVRSSMTTLYRQQGGTVN